MKKIKFLLLLLVIICFSSCTQHLKNDKGVVIRVEYSYQEGTYNVYLRDIDKQSLLCYDFFAGKEFFFETKNSSYHIGDTVKFII